MRDRHVNPYEVLGVTPESSPAEVTSAYRRLAQIYHPDRYAASPEHVQREAERRMQRLNEAYTLVRNGGASATAGTGPGSRAAKMRVTTIYDTRTRVARAVREHQAQARYARSTRVQAAQNATYGEALSQAKPRLPAGGGRSVLSGLGQALHTNQLTCKNCKSIQRLPAGWQEHLHDTNYYCSGCRRLILAR